MNAPARITIDIFSDVMCPWCVIGYKQLERALASLAGEIEADRSTRLGGARFVLHLPGMKILDIAAAAREARERARQQGVETGVS